MNQFIQIDIDQTKKDIELIPKVDCPHFQLRQLEAIQTLAEQQLQEFFKIECQMCSETNENSICLTCSLVYCYKQSNQHMLSHYEQTKHPIALSFADISLWCYECESQITNQQIQSFLRLMFLIKFMNENEDNIENLKCIVDSFQDMQINELAEIDQDDYNLEKMVDKIKLNDENEFAYSTYIEGIKTKQFKKICVLVGAGMSVAAGIPDFRSPGTGLYDQLHKYNLPTPSSIFEIEYFKQNPKAFYTLASEFLLKMNAKPVLAHKFLKLLEDRNQLFYVFTQNIDGLELDVGLSEDILIQAHGHLRSVHCINCKAKGSLEIFKKSLMNGQIYYCNYCQIGLIKPDVVFFGEQLPQKYYRTYGYLEECDLAFVIGTSLQVYPFAELVDQSLKILQLQFQIERMCFQRENEPFIWLETLSQMYKRYWLICILKIKLNDNKYQLILLTIICVFNKEQRILEYQLKYKYYNFIIIYYNYIQFQNMNFQISDTLPSQICSLIGKIFIIISLFCYIVDQPNCWIMYNGHSDCNKTFNHHPLYITNTWGSFIMILLSFCGMMLRREAILKYKNNQLITYWGRNMSFSATMRIAIVLNLTCAIFIFVISNILEMSIPYQYLDGTPIILSYCSSMSWIMSIYFDLRFQKLQENGNLFKSYPKSEIYITYTNLIQTIQVMVLLFIFYLPQVRFVDNQGIEYQFSFTGFKRSAEYNQYLWGICQGTFFCVLNIINLYIYLLIIIACALCLIFRNNSTMNVTNLQTITYMNIMIAILLFILPIMMEFSYPTSQVSQFYVYPGPMIVSYVSLFLLLVCIYLDDINRKQGSKENQNSGIYSIHSHSLLEMK